MKISHATLALLLASSPLLAQAPQQPKPAVAYAGGISGAPQQGAPGMAPNGMPGRPTTGPMGGNGGIAKILELSPEQEISLTTAQADNQKAMVPLQQERAKLLQELSLIANDPKANEAELKSKIAALKNNKKAIIAQQDKYGEKLSSILNVRQQAKLVMLMERQSMQRGPMGRPINAPGIPPAIQDKPATTGGNSEPVTPESTPGIK